jgi:hypothetical protein
MILSSGGVGQFTGGRRWSQCPFDNLFGINNINSIELILFSMNKSHIDFSELGDQTKAIHAGEFPDPVTGASAPNLVMSTTFVVGTNSGFSVEGLGGRSFYLYPSGQSYHTAVRGKADPPGGEMN